jgi:hypothetical protein
MEAKKVLSLVYIMEDAGLIFVTNEFVSECNTAHH